MTRQLNSLARILALATFILIPRQSLAAICSTQSNDPNRVSDFLQSVIAAAKHVYDANDATQNKKPADLQEIFFENKRAMEQIDCAISIVDAFKDSKNEVIKSSSLLFTKALRKIVAANEEIRNELRDELDGKTSKDGAGSIADRQSSRSIAIQNAYEEYIMAIAGSMYSIDRQSLEGDPSKIAFLTQKERDELLKEVNSVRSKIKATKKYPYQFAFDVLHEGLIQKKVFAKVPQK